MRRFSMVRAAAWGMAVGPIVSLASIYLRGQRVVGADFAYNLGMLLGAGATAAFLFMIIGALLNLSNGNRRIDQNDANSVDPHLAAKPRQLFSIITYIIAIVVAYLVVAAGIQMISESAKRDQLRQILLQGEMSSYWNTVQAETPDLFEIVLEDIHRRRNDFSSQEEVLRAVNTHVLDIRMSLAEDYANFLSDIQRQGILHAYLDVLLAAQATPQVCATVIVNGAAVLRREDILPLIGPLDAIAAITIKNLAQAGREPQIVNSQQRLPIDADYDAWALEAFRFGLTEEGLSAIANVDNTHPDFCDASIATYRALLVLDGEAGEALRTEQVNLMLLAPQPVGP